MRGRTRDRGAGSVEDDSQSSRPPEPRPQVSAERLYEHALAVLAAGLADRLRGEEGTAGWNELHSLLDGLEG